MNNEDEKILREFVRRTFVKKMLQEQKKKLCCKSKKFELMCGRL